MVTPVSHYGVHWAPGKIAFLHQTRVSNAVGLNVGSPFEVRTARRSACNHLVSLNAMNPARNHMTAFEKLVQENGLVRFMLPIPKDRQHSAMFYTKSIDDDLLYITLLMKMSSPVKLPIFWANTASPATLASELSMTNVQPLVLAGVTLSHLKMVRDLRNVAMTSERKLLIIAHPDVALTGELSSDHLYSQDENDLAALPWEQLGSMILRGYMRSEWDGNWLIREPVPGNESKSLR